MIARKQPKKPAPPMTVAEVQQAKKLLAKGMSQREVAIIFSRNPDVIRRIDKGIYQGVLARTNRKAERDTFDIGEGGMPDKVDTRTMKTDFELPKPEPKENLDAYIKRLEKTKLICNEAVVWEGTLSPTPLTIDMRAAAIRRFNAMGPDHRAPKAEAVEMRTVPVMHAMAAIREAWCRLDEV